MIITVLTISVVSASLESTAWMMNEVVLPSFLTIDDVKKALDVKHVMMNSIFGVGDLIGQLSELLYLSREAAIDHFIANNIPELELVISEVAQNLNALNDIVLASMITRGILPHSSLLPLQTLIQQYIAGKRTMCLYDELPMALRNPVEYAKLFKRVENYRIVHETHPGVSITVPDDRFHDQTEVVSVDHRLFVIRSFGGVLRDRMWKYRKQSDRIYRIVDVVGMCAVDLILPYREVQFDMERRAVFAFSADADHNHLNIWRADSTSAVQLQRPHWEKSLAAVTADGQFFFFLTSTVYLPYGTPLGEVLLISGNMIPTDLGRPATLVTDVSADTPLSTSQIVSDELLLRGSAESLSVLSAQGSELLLSFLHAKDGPVRDKLNDLDARVKKLWFRATMEQQAPLTIAAKPSSIESWLSQMKGLGKITCIPFDEWESWYLGYLDRLTSEGR